jgi:hypothetical protein
VPPLTRKSQRGYPFLLIEVYIVFAVLREVQPLAHFVLALGRFVPSQLDLAVLLQKGHCRVRALGARRR